jgi:hypothetical protein
MGPIFIDEAKMITPRRKRKHILNLTAAFVNVNRKSHDLSAGDVEEAGMGTLSPARKQILDSIVTSSTKRREKGGCIFWSSAAPGSLYRRA